jgi:hypothetical protein
MFTRSIVAALLFASAFHITSIQAATWDAATDFTSTSVNPNSVWSYGYDPAITSGYQFKLFDQFNSSTSTPSWTDATYVSLGTPAFGQNLTSDVINGIQPGQVYLHPGPVADGDAAILRFTAPTASTYNVFAQFFVGDISQTDAWIIKNGDFSSPISFLGSTNSNPSFSQGVYLTAGDTLDFVVGNHGDYFYDTTPLTVQISAVPMPAPVWLFGSGLATLFIRLKRKSA